MLSVKIGRLLKTGLIVTLFLFSAILLADMSPDRTTAERILNAKMEEIKAQSPADLPQKNFEEFYKEVDKKVDKESIPGQGVFPEAKNLYKLEYLLTPDSDKNSGLQQLTVAVHWWPNPNVSQQQTIRMKILVPLPKQETPDKEKKNTQKN